MKIRCRNEVFENLGSTPVLPDPCFVRRTRPGLSYQLAANLETGEGGTAISIVAGLQWQANVRKMDEFSLGIGIPIGVTSDSDDWGLIVDFEFEF